MFLSVSTDGLQEATVIMDADQMTPGVISTIETIATRLKDFHSILVNPPRVSESLIGIRNCDGRLSKKSGDFTVEFWRHIDSVQQLG